MGLLTNRGRTKGASSLGLRLIRTYCLALLMLIVGIAGCGDELGFKVWITSDYAQEVFIYVLGDASDITGNDSGWYVLAPGAPLGQAKFMHVNPEPPTPGRIVVLDHDCRVLAEAEVVPGEHRLVIDADGVLEITPFVGRGPIDAPDLTATSASCEVAPEGD